jgi:hypothetical protein
MLTQGVNTCLRCLPHFRFQNGKYTQFLFCSKRYNFEHRPLRSMFSDNFVIVVELLIISPALYHCYPRSQEVWEHFTFSNKKSPFLRILSLVDHCRVTMLHRLKSAAPSPQFESWQLSPNIPAVCDKHEALGTIILPKTPFQVTNDACRSPVSNTQQISHYVLSRFCTPSPTLFIYSIISTVYVTFFIWHVASQLN